MGKWTLSLPGWLQIAFSLAKPVIVMGGDIDFVVATAKGQSWIFSSAKFLNELPNWFYVAVFIMGVLWIWYSFGVYQGRDFRRAKYKWESRQQVWYRKKTKSGETEGPFCPICTYHKLSPKHLQAYLEELEWRFNNRDNPWLFRDTVQRLIASGNVEYKELTA